MRNEHNILIRNNEGKWLVPRNSRGRKDNIQIEAARENINRIQAV